eukprot:TRINITY_DN41107_c0_g1_i1.p1 TRINITY_DN41107_c0_g1~~TRINITY_DN41107_c0_g1_i1.p1  ORF type:complete len:533 (-),score=112.83 TRINITY_DN41107_c0_g1_i1:459-1991(-)
MAYDTSGGLQRHADAEDGTLPRLLGARAPQDVLDIKPLAVTTPVETHEVVSAAETSMAPPESSESAVVKRLKEEHHALRELLVAGRMLDFETQRERDASLRDFVAKSMATTAAFISAQTAFSYLRILAEHTEGMRPAVFVLLLKLIYAVFATVACPIVMWRLKLYDGSHTASVADFLLLVKSASPMTLAWAWRDVVIALDGLHLFGDAFAIQVATDLGIAVVVTLLIAVAEISPCYKRERLKVLTGGEGDRLWSRYVLLPGQLGLANGYAWNQVATHVITKIMRLMPDDALMRWLVQAVYCALCLEGVRRVTRRFKAAKLVDDQAAPDDGTFSWQDVVEKGQELEYTLASNVVNSLSFVFAWALSDTLNLLVFDVFLGCNGPSECSYKYNFAYCCIISVVGAGLVFEAKQADRALDEHHTLHTLRITALTLTVGWAWATFSATWVDYLVAESSFRTQDSDHKDVATANYYLIIFVCHWVLLGLLFHDFMRNRRDKAKVRERWKDTVARLP